MTQAEETKRLVERLQASADKIRHEIIDFIGLEYKVGRETWILHSNNDLGVLYWHKKNRKKLYTIAAYRHTDLAHIFKDADLPYDVLYGAPINPDDYGVTKWEPKGDARGQVIVTLPADAPKELETKLVNSLGSQYYQQGNLIKFWTSTGIVPLRKLELAARIVRGVLELKQDPQIIVRVVGKRGTEEVIRNSERDKWEEEHGPSILLAVEGESAEDAALLERKRKSKKEKTQ